MTTAITERTRDERVADQPGGGDSPLIFGVPYQHGDRTMIPVAELLDGAGPSDEPGDSAERGLIQERALGLIEIAEGRADYRPITHYRRSLMIMGAIGLVFVVIAAVWRSRTRSHR